MRSLSAVSRRLKFNSIGRRFAAPSYGLGHAMRINLNNFVWQVMREE